MAVGSSTVSGSVAATLVRNWPPPVRTTQFVLAASFGSAAVK